jgi:hypothetical protein
LEWSPNLRYFTLVAHIIADKKLEMGVRNIESRSPPLAKRGLDFVVSISRGGKRPGFFNRSAGPEARRPLAYIAARFLEKHT